jgi:hypothetical protein
LLGRVKPKKSILRYLLRPWLLFKRKWDKELHIHIVGS